MVPLLLLAFAGVALFEVPGLIQERYWRELAAFFILWCLGLILSLALVLGVEFPKVATAINDFIKTLFGL